MVQCTTKLTWSNENNLSDWATESKNQYIKFMIFYISDYYQSLEISWKNFNA